jgi:hypothetical protein
VTTQALDVLRVAIPLRSPSPENAREAAKPRPETNLGRDARRGASPANHRRGQPEPRCAFPQHAHSVWRLVSPRGRRTRASAAGRALMRAREASLVLTRQRLGDMCLDQESQEQEKLEAPTPRRSDTFRRVSDPLSAYSLSPGPPRSPPAPQPAPATNAAASGYIVSKSQWVGSPPAQGFRGNWRTWQEVSDDDSMLVWDEVSLPLSAPLLPSPPSGPLPLAGGGGARRGCYTQKLATLR